MKRILCFAMVIVLLLVSVSCGNSGKNEASNSQTGTDVVKIPSPTGADSVQVLIEKSLEFFRNDCSYSKIEDVHDPVAYLALYMMEDLLRDQDLTFEQAKEKAALIYGSAEDLKAVEPELEQAIREEFDVMEPEEAVSEYMTELRNAMRSGEIKSDDPKYDKYSKMLTDWDKGTEYMLENYPDMFDSVNIPIGMDNALKLLRQYVTFQKYNNDIKRFKDLEVEFKPENIYVGEDGICSYDMGNIVDGNDSWSISMEYYYKDGRYFIICYSIVVGGIGG